MQTACPEGYVNAETSADAMAPTPHNMNTPAMKITATRRVFEEYLLPVTEPVRLRDKVSAITRLLAAIRIPIAIPRRPVTTRVGNVDIGNAPEKTGSSPWQVHCGNSVV